MKESNTVQIDRTDLNIQSTLYINLQLWAGARIKDNNSKSANFKYDFM